MKHRTVSPLLVFLLGIACAPVAPAAEPWHRAEAALLTRWAADVSPADTLPEYPRPQLVRQKWQSLNGLWEYALADKDAAAPASYPGSILVPFVYESALSGVGKPSVPDKRLWYRRTFTVPPDWQGQRVLLHFDAVNWQSAASLNGKELGEHRGGYTAFGYDVTDFLKPGENELIVAVSNPLKDEVPDAQVLGKQRSTSHGIWYTAATGIWQSVWLEPVPAAHIDRLKITPDVGHGAVRVAVQAAGDEAVKIAVRDGDAAVAAAEGRTNAEITLPIPNPRLWSPDDPHLYDLEVTLAGKAGGADRVNSYFGMREISLGKDDKGILRVLLNGKFVFQKGVLDQGYWPDGIYTAPTDAALRFDLETVKKLGFNLDRKHAKVEPDRWYYWADKLGILVWQDMPQMFGKKQSPKDQASSAQIDDAAKQQFETEWRREIEQFYDHPSIVVWTPFNEGWGQHDTAQVVALTKQLDPTRLVNAASGWVDEGVGDIDDTHNYPPPKSHAPSPTRAAVCGEFGGLGLKVDGHMWSHEAWGYRGVLRRPYLLTKSLQDVLKKAYALRDDPGMSAFVLTQLVDVEQEGNGLLTYDRAVTKPDLAVIQPAIQGVFVPLPPDPGPPPMLVPDAEEKGVTWRYTTDHPADQWALPGFDDAGWASGEAVFGNSAAVGIRTPWKTSDIWLRREFTVPDDLPPKLVFTVAHDDGAEIYINGVLAARASGYVTSYVDVPMNDDGRRALKPGKNTLAVHCNQVTGGQDIDVGIMAVK